jgi:aspartate racemase
MNRKWIRCSLYVVVLTAMMVGGWAQSSEAPKNNALGQSLSTEASSKHPPIKTIGIIGGVSWASSIEYYRLMNEMVRDTLGGVHSAQVLMFSIEFDEFSRQERLADKGDWTLMTQTMVDGAERLKRGGADFIVIASNTLNSLADLIQEKVGIRVLHIADATGAKVREKGLRTVALLGTKYTMEQPFYRERLQKYGLKVVTPCEEERDYINTVIFDELCANSIRNESKARFMEIIHRLQKEEGVEGVILGCTEIPLLIKQRDIEIPVFDTTAIHSEAAVKYSLGQM